MAAVVADACEDCLGVFPMAAEDPVGELHDRKDGHADERYGGVPAEEVQAGGGGVAIDDGIAAGGAAAFFVEDGGVFCDGEAVAGSGDAEGVVAIVPVHEGAFVEDADFEDDFARDEHAGEGVIAAATEGRGCGEVSAVAEPGGEVAASPGLYLRGGVHVVKDAANEACRGVRVGVGDEFRAGVGWGDSVVVEQPDVVCAFVDGAADAYVAAGSEAEILAGFKDGDLRIGRADTGDGVVGGTVIDDEDAEILVVLLK